MHKKHDDDAGRHSCRQTEYIKRRKKGIFPKVPPCGFNIIPDHILLFLNDAILCRPCCNVSSRLVQSITLANSLAYSAFRLLTGFASADRMACILSVINAITSAVPPAIKNTAQLISTLYAKS